MSKRGLQLPDYEGDEPFVYAYFAHADRRRAYPFLRQLRERHFRICCISEERPDGALAERMAERIEHSQVVLLFCSSRANAVPVWRYQVNHAASVDKNIFLVLLDERALQSGMHLQSGGAEIYRAADAPDPEAFFGAFVKSAGVTQELIGDAADGYSADVEAPGLLRRSGFYVACAALVVAAALMIVLPPRIRALREARSVAPTQIEYMAVIVFSEPMIQQAVLTSLGKAESDALFEEELQSVRSLAICANKVLKDTDVVRYKVAAGRQRAFINGYEAGSGHITDIRELAMLPNLENLTISGQAITDISALENLGKLVSLDISGNPITDLSPLASLAGLTTLDISCVAAEDFSVLSALTNLNTLATRNVPAALEVAKRLPIRSLCASESALSGAMDDIAGMQALESLDISGTDVSSIEALRSLRRLHTLHLRGCEGIRDMDTLTAFPALTRVTLGLPAVLALPDDTFRGLIDKGVEIVL